MDPTLLEQLMKKPIAQKQEKVKIVLPGKGEVAIKMKIVERKRPDLDIAALRKRLQAVGKVHHSVVAAAPSVEIDIEEQKPAAPAAAPRKTAKREPSTKIARKPKSMFPGEEPIEEPEADDLAITIGRRTIGTRLPKERKKILVRSSSYFMNNRKKFIEFITTLLLPYRRQLTEEGGGASCDRKSDKFSLLTHQKIVRDYINEFTPYRGLLLYHGLGSGKTCSSIAIAEGLKSTRRIIIMTPASLRMNYIQELKKCGDSLYKLNQYWEFIKTEEKPEWATALSRVLSLPKSFIDKQGGAWFVNVKRKSNYARLNATQRRSLDAQVSKMLNAKYLFINYNGLRKGHIPQLQAKLKQPNLFDHSVVIIDEVHNFVSRIVNKMKQKKSLSMKLYEYLKKAKDCRIICLTGTPVINYPNEIAILFNMLRGYITTFTLPLTITTQQKVNEQRMKAVLKSLNVLDYIRYQASLKQLVVTRNPFGFVNSDKVGEKTRDERGDLSDDDFLDNLIGELAKKNIEVNKKQIKRQQHTALPDNLDGFTQWFINERSGELQNQNIFKKRILGLTSHFRSPQEELMPAFDKETDLHVVEVPMSDYQLGIYEEAREGERKTELEQAKRAKKRRAMAAAGATEGLYEESSSTYRIFSRAFCNFVFPGEIKRPLPREDGDVMQAAQEKLDEDILDNADAEQKIQNIDGRFTPDDAAELKATLSSKVDKTYEIRIQEALANLKKHSAQFLSKAGLSQLSPKFLAILNNIEENKGLHLIYSQFRTLEGIGIFQLVLEANGFAQLKIAKNAKGTWHISQTEEEKAKPKYILYTGTESVEEKEIVQIHLLLKLIGKCRFLPKF